MDMKNLQVQVVNAQKEVIWAHGHDAAGHRSGITSRNYPSDGTLDAILGALAKATSQASAEKINLG